MVRKALGFEHNCDCLSGNLKLDEKIGIYVYMTWNHFVSQNRELQPQT